jgi:hypothetical protein
MVAWAALLAIVEWALIALLADKASGTPGSWSGPTFRKCTSRNNVHDNEIGFLPPASAQNQGEPHAGPLVRRTASLVASDYAANFLIAIECDAGAGIVLQSCAMQDE